MPSAPPSTTAKTTFAATFAELVEQPVSARLDVLASAVAVLLDQPVLPGGGVCPPPIRRDVRDRVVACGLLGGALGRSAVEALVRALDDRSPQVRAAAVAALGVTAAVKGHEHRLAFAVLHRRADVRRATLLAPSLSPTLLGLLLADERVGEDAMASLSQRLASEPRLAHTVIALHRLGHLGDVDAAELLRRLPWHQATAIFAALPHSPSTTRLGECDGDALAALLSTSTDDHLVDVVRLVFGSPDTLEGSKHIDDGVGDRAGDRVGAGASILAALHDALATHRLDTAHAERLALATIVAVAMGVSVPDDLVAIAANVAPGILGCPLLPRHQRLAATTRLVRLGLPRHDAPLAMLLRPGTDLVDLATLGIPATGRTATTTTTTTTTAAANAMSADVEDTSLPVLGGLLRLCRTRPWAKLFSIVGAPALARLLVDALQHGPTHAAKAAALLSLAPSGGDDRAAYNILLKLMGDGLRAVPRRERSRWVDGVAHVMLDVPGDAHRLLGDLAHLDDDVVVAIATCWLAPSSAQPVPAAVPAAAPTAGPAEIANPEVQRRRRQRATETLARHSSASHLRPLLCLVAEAILAQDEGMPRDQRLLADDLLRALCVRTSAEAIAVVVDDLDDQRQAALFPGILTWVPPQADVAVSTVSPEPTSSGGRSAWHVLAAQALPRLLGVTPAQPRPSRTLDALQARDNNVAVDVGPELEEVPASTLAAAAWRASLGRRVFGCAPLVERRRHRHGAAGLPTHPSTSASTPTPTSTLTPTSTPTSTPTPAMALLVASILVSHDAVSRVAAAVASVWGDGPSASDDEDLWVRIRDLLRQHPPAQLPLLALAALHEDDEVLGRLDVELRAIPGQLRGAIELALALPAPLDGVLMEALIGVTRRRRYGLGPWVPTGGDTRARDFLAAALRDVGAGAGGADVAGGAGETAAWVADATLVARMEALAVLLDPRPTAESASDARPPTPPTVHRLPPLLGPAGQFDDFVDHGTGESIVQAASAALLLGPLGVAGARLLPLLRRCPQPARDVLVLQALRDVDDVAVLQPLLRLLPLRLETLSAVERLSGVCAWGSRQSLRITGRPFGMSFIGDALGYTRLKSQRIHVNPLPLLLGEEDGVDVVKGLIVHELGHHRFHAGADGLAVWEQAQKEHNHQLLNLVADEHLERKLRAQSPTRYGGPLKRLAAWAFQHMHRELPLEKLLKSLGPNAGRILGALTLGVGRRADGIVVDVGGALLALETDGSSFARFMRALRMGKGDRDRDDPRVAEALALFPARHFQASTMPELLEIARQLRRIFGEECRLLDTFELHELTDTSPDDLAKGGVDLDDLESAAQRHQPRRRLRRPPPKGSGKTGGPALRVTNDGDDDSFDIIETIERIPVDPLAWRGLSDQVRRPAARLRATLASLGRGWVSQRRRLSGRRLDRQGLVGAVVRGDPRLLTSRRVEMRADLFVGVAIDCSGSMAGENLERAQLFAAVLAEAARGIPGIDTRFFGFTDNTIYDAGDARHCAVAGLDADGGNNDAAGLFHVANVARRSRRQTRLLVMISDGSPTECSVDALRDLVARLTRQGFLCAQVAVEDLDDMCFPHYVLLDDDDLAGAVRAFAGVLERLILMGVKGGNAGHAGGGARQR